MYQLVGRKLQATVDCPRTLSPKSSLMRALGPLDTGTDPERHAPRVDMAGLPVRLLREFLVPTRVEERGSQPMRS